MQERLTQCRLTWVMLLFMWSMDIAVCRIAIGACVTRMKLNGRKCLVVLCVILLHSKKKETRRKVMLHMIHYASLKCEIDGSGGLKCLTWNADCGSVEWCWQDRTV